MTTIITILSVVITALFGFITKLMGDKNKLETHNRQLKSEASTGKLEGVSNDSIKKAIADRDAYRDLVREFDHGYDDDTDSHS